MTASKNAAKAGLTQLSVSLKGKAKATKMGFRKV